MPNARVNGLLLPFGSLSIMLKLLTFLWFLNLQTSMLFNFASDVALHLSKVCAPKTCMEVGRHGFCLSLATAAIVYLFALAFHGK